jgi:probable H4MPT-linked C1 transfer pathway protein
MDVLGLDIGGANLKAAHTGGAAASVAFALWRHPERLADELKSLCAAMPPADRVAVTMTGELCDCFDSKADGVARILDAVAEVFGADRLDVWTTTGTFMPPRVARERWLLTASANWLALATFAGRFAPPGPALLLDIGTTTTDIIPLRDGVPVPEGHTDLERLRSRELLYRGWRRTPLCALFDFGAAELFATMHDMCLVLRLCPEDEADRDTADGRPATHAAARRRLARMLCAEPDDLSEDGWQDIARNILERFADAVVGAIQRVCRWTLRVPQPGAVIVSGSGAFLAAELHGLPATVLYLEDHLSPALSSAACAYAVAVLRTEAG